MKLLKNAVDAFDEADEDREVALVNLGHCYRKIGKYEQSVDVVDPGPRPGRVPAWHLHRVGLRSSSGGGSHQRSRRLSQGPSPLRPEDPFAISMLELALEESEPLTLDRLVVAGGDSATTGGDMMGD